MPLRKTDLAEAKMQLEKSRKDLGIQYDDNTLESIDVESQPINDEIEDYKSSFGKLEAAKNMSEERLSESREEVDEKYNLKNNHFMNFCSQLLCFLIMI